MLLNDRTAVVTGGASGIGRATALMFADHGADVVIADRRETPREGGRPTADRIEAETEGTARYVETDVSDLGALEAVFDTTDALGGLDVLVNNAGVFRHGDPLETSPEEYDRVADVNTRATFFATQRAGRRMQDQGEGAIVNVASTSGFRADGAIAAYCASKAAIIQLTRAFADALGPAGVRVNAVCPGAIDTELARDRSQREREALIESIPLRRVGAPEDVAKAITFLASDLASYVTGEALVADGGLTV